MHEEAREVGHSGEMGEARARAEAALNRFPWDAELLAVLDRLRSGGHRACLVGGSVRDVLLGRAASAAYDVATDRLPETVQALFPRVEPIGIEHGTVLILTGGMRVECTTFRREGTYPDARHPEHVEFSRDPVEDLGRRDLTVNAMAYDPRSGRLLDPHGGAFDLERRILRAVGDPAQRFHEDALRPLRVARLAATLEMTPEARTRRALGSALERARLVAPERVRDEIERLLAAPRPSVGFELLREAGLLALWLPELARCVGVPQNRFHAYDVYQHSLFTCDAARPERLRVRWAALLHDIGKPDTRVERRGDGTFYNHQFVGGELADRMLERLRLPADERRAIVHLIREHMFDYRPEWSDAAVRRWLRRIGIDCVEDLLALREADVRGSGRDVAQPVAWVELRERIARLIAASRVFRVGDLAVDGHDVMRVLGVSPGPEVRAVLEALLEEVLDRPERNERERLLERLVQWRTARTKPASAG